jgi:hypothetical protein
MRRDKNGDPLLARQLDQQFPKAVAGYRVNARGWLVEDQDLWLVDHGHSQRQALAYAQGQAIR